MTSISMIDKIKYNSHNRGTLSMMRLFKLLMGIFMLVLLLNCLFPPQQLPEPTDRITLMQVSEKSKDALVTTAAFMRQEKIRIGAAMSVTLQKLDRMIAQLQDKTGSLPQTERGVWHHKIRNWQTTRNQVVQLQSRLGPAENGTMDHIKNHWQAVEVDISDRLLRETP